MSSVHRDAGLQRERTALSWQRTALSTAVVTALSLREAAAQGWGAATLPVAAASAVMLVTTVLCLTRVRALRTGHAGVGVRAAALFSSAVVLSAAAAGAALAW